jgi:hypothetical protein
LEDGIISPREAGKLLTGFNREKASVLANARELLERLKRVLDVAQDDKISEKLQSISLSGASNHGKEKSGIEALLKSVTEPRKVSVNLPVLEENSPKTPAKQLFDLLNTD